MMSGETAPTASSAITEAFLENVLARMRSDIRDDIRADIRDLASQVSSIAQRVSNLERVVFHSHTIPSLPVTTEVSDTELQKQSENVTRKGGKRGSVASRSAA